LLADIRVADFAVGMAAALVSKFLAELGATVHRVPPPRGDPFTDVYPAYAVWRIGSTLNTLASTPGQPQDALLRQADVCILGGEDYPGLVVKRDAEVLAERYPRLIVLNITACPAGMAADPLPGVDLLAQARSGIISEFVFGTPIPLSFEPANYGAMLHGLEGLGAALFERERSGKGQVVSVSMLEGAMCWLQPLWISATKPTAKFNFNPPKEALPLVLKCRDGRYVHVVLGAAGSKYRLYQVLGIEDPALDPNDSGLPNLKDAPEKYYGDADLLQTYVERCDSGEFLRALWKAQIVAEPVLAPGECWNTEQVRHNDIIRTATDGTCYVGHPATIVASPATRRPALHADPRPLAGIRVVDFGAFVAGPMSSIVLADLGAEVIKIEPIGGDVTRMMHKFYAAANRGKRVIAIDLKQPEGVALAHRLCEQADVVCSNFKVGAAGRLGIDAASLHAKKPATIVVINAGYGVGGAMAGNPAFDPAMQALCGHELRAGGIGNRPMVNRVAPLDFAGGRLGGILTLMALYRRAREGAGADLTVPLLNVGVFMLSQLTRRADGRFEGTELLDAERKGFHPAERLYATRDGWIAVAARDPRSAQQLVTACGLVEQIQTPRCAWGAAEAQALAAHLLRCGTYEALRALKDAGVWAERCMIDRDSCASALGEPTLVASGTIYEARNTEFGTVKGMGSFFHLSRSTVSASGHTAVRGEDTQALLKELNLSSAEIADLYARKVVA
jgi:crotonobetainyl-CoA:carnitine CoA-transferase CaiB-like acyl-CoA transferase